MPKIKISSSIIIFILTVFTLSHGAACLNDFPGQSAVLAHLHAPDAPGISFKENTVSIFNFIKDDTEHRVFAHRFTDVNGIPDVVFIDMTEGLIYHQRRKILRKLGSKMNNVLIGHGNMISSVSSAPLPENLSVRYFVKPGESLSKIAQLLIAHGEFDLARMYQEDIFPGTWKITVVRGGQYPPEEIYQPYEEQAPSESLVYLEYPPPIAYSESVPLTELFDAYSKHFLDGEIIILNVATCRNCL